MMMVLWASKLGSKIVMLIIVLKSIVIRRLVLFRIPVLLFKLNKTPIWVVGILEVGVAKP